MSDLYIHPLDGFTEEEFQAFLLRVGTIFWNASFAARKAGHRWPLNTIRDYLDVYKEDDKVSGRAKEYARDLTKMTTAELAQKWRNDVFPDVETWANAVIRDRERMAIEMDSRRRQKRLSERKARTALRRL